MLCDLYLLEKKIPFHMKSQPLETHMRFPVVIFYAKMWLNIFFPIAYMLAKTASV